MHMAYQLALRGRETASPNPMVGAVIVKNGRVIAQGFHHHRGGPHAEVVALRKLRGRLAAAKMYVTLEPCSHVGLTPPCVDALIASGIREVVIGVKDPNPKTNGRSIAKLRRAGIAVRVGILQDELTQMNESFNKYIKTQMPFVVAKTAQTLDGKIATRNGHSRWITSKRSRVFGHLLRNEFDAIMVGINTVLKDNPGLNPQKKTKRLKKIIVDSRLRIPVNARLFQNTRPADCFIAATKNASATKQRILQKQGVSVIICPDKGGRVDLRFLFRELARRGIAKILLEGGGVLIGSALKARLVDKIMVFVAPKILGDSCGINSVAGLSPRKISQSVQLRDLSVRKIGEDMFMEGYVR